jgi:stress response protein YsnF
MTDRDPSSQPTGVPDLAAQPQPHGDSLTVSEERLQVTTRKVPVATVRLERYQVTETRTITVDVVRDRVRMVTTVEGADPEVSDDPAADEDRTGDGTADAATTADGSGWLVLSEEQVVVTKTVVPVERVRLRTTTIVTEQVVTEPVRAERVELLESTAGTDVPPTS